MIALGVLWGLQFPIVKNIWTSSYVLVCGGLSALLLGVFHQVIDAWGRKRWATTFIWIGASAITLYLINGIVGFQPLATKLVGGELGSFVDSHLTPGAGSLLAHSVGLLFAVALAGFLYRRKIWACVCGDPSLRYVVLRQTESADWDTITDAGMRLCQLYRRSQAGNSALRIVSS